MAKAIVLSLLVLVGVTFLAHSTFGGLRGLKCVHKYLHGPCGDGSGCNFTDPKNVFFLGCESDCQANHNANRGRCIRDNYCVCSDLKKTVNRGSLQCLDINKAQFYQTICSEDCQCAHKAAGGGCNFYTKGCECGPPIRDNTCPYKSSNEYFINLVTKYQTVGIDLIGIYVAQSKLPPPSA